MTPRIELSQEEINILLNHKSVNKSAIVSPAEFVHFSDVQEKGKEVSPPELISDVPLEISVELGRTKRKIREILELDKGSVLELEKLAGEPVEVYVNGKLIALGEVIMMNEVFGIRITDIL